MNDTPECTLVWNGYYEPLQTIISIYSSPFPPSDSQLPKEADITDYIALIVYVSGVIGAEEDPADAGMYQINIAWKKDTVIEDIKNNTFLDLINRSYLAMEQKSKDYQIDIGGANVH